MAMTKTLPNSIKIAFFSLLLLQIISFVNAQFPIEQFLPFGPQFGDAELERADDANSSAIELDVPFPFFDQLHDRLWINTNGIITFLKPLDKEDIPDCAANVPHKFQGIAPFWADIDTSCANGGNIFYRQTTTNVTQLELTRSQVLDAFPYLANTEMGAFKWMFVATWDRVKHFRCDDFNEATNTFQAVLATDGQASFAIFFYNQMQWAIPKEEQSACPKQKTDLIFVVDGSGSIGSTMFYNEVLRFIKQFIEHFDIGMGKTRVGLIHYNDVAYHEIKINDYEDKQSLLNAIGRISYREGATYTGNAIWVMTNQGFSTFYGARNAEEVTRVGIVITDGESQDSILEPANVARNKSIHLFAIGVAGGSKNRHQLDTLSGSSNSTFIANEFQDLDRSLSMKVQKLTCQTVATIKNVVPLAGFDSGDGKNRLLIPRSCNNASMLEINKRSNVNRTGAYFFRLDNAKIESAGCIESLDKDANNQELRITPNFVFSIGGEPLHIQSPCLTNKSAFTATCRFLNKIDNKTIENRGQILSESKILCFTPNLARIGRQYIEVDLNNGTHILTYKGQFYVLDSDPQISPRRPDKHQFQVKMTDANGTMEFRWDPASFQDVSFVQIGIIGYVGNEDGHENEWKLLNILLDDHPNTVYQAIYNAMTSIGMRYKWCQEWFENDNGTQKHNAIPCPPTLQLAQNDNDFEVSNTFINYFHKGAKICFRTKVNKWKRFADYVTFEPLPAGQQCCYKAGKLLVGPTGVLELPELFFDVQLFPAVTLRSDGSIRVNFGKDKWRFNPFQLVPMHNNNKCLTSTPIISTSSSTTTIMSSTLMTTTEISSNELPEKFYGHWIQQRTENWEAYLNVRYNFLTRGSVRNYMRTKNIKHSSNDDGRFDWDILYKNVKLDEEFLCENIAYGIIRDARIFIGNGYVAAEVELQEKLNSPRRS